MQNSELSNCSLHSGDLPESQLCTGHHDKQTIKRIRCTISSLSFSRHDRSTTQRKQQYAHRRYTTANKETGDSPKKYLGMTTRLQSSPII